MYLSRKCPNHGIVIGRPVTTHPQLERALMDYLHERNKDSKPFASLTQETSSFLSQ